jgi:nucleotide-binding universal stress UspA family protein
MEASTMTDTSRETPRQGSIVVGIDGSEGAARALSWAVEQARAENRPLTLLHSGGESLLRTTLMLDADVDHVALFDRLRTADLALLTRSAAAVTEADPDLAVDVVLVETDARTALVDASRRAHLVVLGSRGRGRVASMVLGSVSRYVAAHAACPVVVCRGPAGGGRPRRVVVGAAWTASSVPVTEFAFHQASVYGVPLTVLHALWLVPESLAERPLVTVDDTEGVGAMLAESVAGLREKYPDVTVLFELRRGLADDCLVRWTPEDALLVVGRPTHDLVTKVLEGTTALSVVERSLGVVAVVPEAGSEP